MQTTHRFDDRAEVRAIEQDSEELQRRLQDLQLELSVTIKVLAMQTSVRSRLIEVTSEIASISWILGTRTHSTNSTGL